MLAVAADVLGTPSWPFAGCAGRLLAVDEVSLTIDQGEMVGVIGPNASGKTTPFLIITGNDARDSGEVCLHGLRPNRIARLGVARMFQLTHLRGPPPRLDLGGPGVRPRAGASTAESREDSRLRRAIARAIWMRKGGRDVAKALEKPSLYDTDYVAWLEQQVAHLRAGRLQALDVENVAEELEGLMRSQRQQMENRLEVLILHLLKWDHQPAQRSNRWRSSVAEQRGRIRRLLRDSPSLRPALEEASREVYSEAVERAAIETGLAQAAFPACLPYTVEQIFERELPAEELPDHPST